MCDGEDSEEGCQNNSNVSVFCLIKVTWRGYEKWNGRNGTVGRDQVGGYYRAVGATDKGLSQDWGRKGAV